MDIINGTKFHLHAKKVIIMAISGLLNAIAMNFFLVPSNVFASGFTGLAQLIAAIVEMFTSFQLSTGILVFLLNVPVFLIGWKVLGRSFTVYSLLSVVFMSFFLEVIPVYVVTPDSLLNAIAGGVILAVGVGITFRVGASTGGLDIIAMIASIKKDRPLGTFFFAFNAVIIVTAGYLFSWEQALYTLVSLYVTSRVIDMIHTSHVKLTAMIVTSHGEEMKKAIHEKLVRGITAIPAKGAFSNEDRDLLMIVLTRYELYDLENVIKKVDPNAFTNIVETVGVVGLFRK